MDTAILRLHCADTKGIVYNVSKFIFERGGNIITSSQHKEELDEQFFMRVHFDCADIASTREELLQGLAELAGQFSMETQITFSEDRKRLATMVSKYDHCLYDLLLRHQYGELNLDIPLVVSNHVDLQRVASMFKVPFYHIPVEKGKKEAAETKALELFSQYDIDFVVLARYMQILTPRMLDAYPNGVINVHHGFLPAFAGANPYHQAYEKGVKLIGASSHYATEELDQGPIIAQEVIRVDHTHSVKDMQILGRDIEKQVLAKAVRDHAEDRIMVYKNRTIIFG